ncbi:hypothetical protein Tco_0568833 [Tanacetum coccineum]
MGMPAKETSQGRCPAFAWCEETNDGFVLSRYGSEAETDTVWPQVHDGGSGTMAMDEGQCRLAESTSVNHLYKTMPITTLSGNPFPECCHSSENAS